VEILQRFGELSRSPYLSFSGGKDSLVMTDIALKIIPGARILYRDCGATMPGTFELFAELEKRWEKKIEIWYSKQTIFDVFRQYGLNHPRLEHHTHRILITESMKEWLAENPSVDGYAMGLRAQESAGRRRLAKYRGSIFKTKWYKKKEMWACVPLIWWRVEEVWAYIDYYELPYHPAYESKHHHPREDLRLGVWAGESNIQWGRWVWLRYYYPELWQELVREFPEASTYT